MSEPSRTRDAASGHNLPTSSDPESIPTDCMVGASAEGERDLRGGPPSDRHVGSTPADSGVARTAATHRGAADIGYLRAIYENAPRLAEMHLGDYGPITPLTREIILSLLDELEAKLDAS